MDSAAESLQVACATRRMQSIFYKFGIILSYKIIEENGRSKEFGFVKFELEESAHAAIKFLHDIDDKALQELFNSYEHLTSTKVMWYAYGVSKGIGFVFFSSPKEAKKALEALHGTHFHGATLYVTYA
ncbi:RNA recognition motif domain [Dillenia turbinata]|uniref:RNA recognition motif domain n=1 Tax=Dillenia turbinata TaxID=194707 RepID=A0AAN8Z802_9MAGN